MKKYLLSLAVVLAGITLLASCDDNDGPSYQYVTYSNGAYVVNAGNMSGSIDGTLTYIRCPYGLPEGVPKCQQWPESRQYC